MSVILLGLGRYVEEIVEVVSAISDVVLVERDEARLRAFLEKAPVANLRALPGSATDVGLWKEVDPEAAEAVISFLSVEATLDVARLLRKALGYRSKIVHVSKARPDPQAVRELDLEVVSIPEVLGAILRNLLQGQGIVRYPVGIGLRKGRWWRSSSPSPPLRSTPGSGSSASRGPGWPWSTGRGAPSCPGPTSGSSRGTGSSWWATPGGWRSSWGR